MREEKLNPKKGGTKVKGSSKIERIESKQVQGMKRLESSAKYK